MNLALAAMSCDNATGIGRIVRSLAAEFGRGGHHVTVAAQTIDALPPGVRAARFPAVPFSPAMSRIAFALQSSKYFGRQRFDVVNAFGVGRGASVITAQSCHQAAVELQSRSRHHRIGKKGLGIFDRVALHDERLLMTATTTKLIIAVSRLVKEQIQNSYGVPENKIRVIPNGVGRALLNPDDSKDHRAAIRSDMGFREADFVLLFIANEFDRKGLETIVDAMNILQDPSVHCVILGDDDPRPYLHKARVLGLDRRLRFLGSVAGPERYFGVADAFVLPTWYEPFGMVIIEAMAAKVPVIASGAAGALEGMAHGTDALFLNDPFSADELADAITRLHGDSDLCARMAANAFRSIRRFSWEQVAGQTLSAYRDLIGPPGGPS